MGRHYRQLDFDERIELDRLRDAGYSIRDIGRIMGRCHTTISRELRRNCLRVSGYKPYRAQIMSEMRCERQCRLQRESTLRAYVHDRLAMGWSPEQISGRLSHKRSCHIISHETIYRYIYRKDMRAQRLWRYLPQHKARRGLRYFKSKQAPPPDMMGIAHRPQVIEDRQQFGHWEGDLMQFRTQRGALLSTTERLTRFNILSPLQTKTAAETGQAIVEELAALPPKARKSITFDRGGEFADHKTIKEALSVDVWYCDPHSPWQRGTVENANGIIRRDMPRKTDIKNYTRSDIKMLQHMLNTTPRKCLGYQTPQEAFIQNLNETNGALDL